MSEKGITTHTESNLSKVMKCYCGFVSETENELKSHVLKVHGARDGDWKGWVSG
jgi:hypothetical protein